MQLQKEVKNLLRKLNVSLPTKAIATRFYAVRFLCVGCEVHVPSLPLLPIHTSCFHATHFSPIPPFCLVLVLVLVLVLLLVLLLVLALLLGMAMLTVGDALGIDRTLLLRLAEKLVRQQTASAKKEPSSLRKDGLTSLLQRSTVSVVCFVLFHGLKGIKHAAGRAGVLLRALSNWAPGCCEAGCPASRACVWVSSLSSHTHTHSHAHAHALTRTHLTRCIPPSFFSLMARV